ncbi:MAG: hypothetical protein LBL80_03785 [Ruminococcus sp.]|jgi:hypothetical protein|nr:hypothetical protein [Ruminococcus sp.]
MKKRTLSVALAAVTAFSLAVPAVVVNAADEDYIPSSGHRYASEFVYGDTIYFYPNLEAYYEFNSIPPLYTKAPQNAYSADRFYYFDNTTGNYVESSQRDRAGVYRIIGSYISGSGSQYTSYRAGNGLYYPTLEMAQQHTGTGARVSTILRAGSGVYFSTYSGNYYSTYANALSGSAGNASYVMMLINGTYYDYISTPLFQNTITNKYYFTEAEAKAANPKGKIKTSSTPTQGYYFNRATGRFYILQADAVNATRNEEDVIAATSYAYGGSYYYNGVYNPFYTTPTTPSTSNSNTTDAYLLNNKSYTGWTRLANYINGRRDGSDVSIDMNKQLTVPKTFFDDIKLKDVDVTFVNGNGSRLTINGADLTDTKAINVSVTYGSSNIPSSVINSYKDGALSASQMIIGDDSSFGVNSNLSVAFNKSRSGKTVRIYRYNRSSGKLSLVDSSVIGTDGRATFSISRGGDYCAIILK